MTGWACRVPDCPEDTGEIRHTSTHGDAIRSALAHASIGHAVTTRQEHP